MISSAKGTLLPVVEKLREVMKKVAHDKSFIEAIKAAGEEVHYMSHEEFSKFSKMESNKIGKIWAPLIKESPPK